MGFSMAAASSQRLAFYRIKAVVLRFLMDREPDDIDILLVGDEGEG